MKGKGIIAERYQVMSKFWKEALGLAAYYHKKNKLDLPKLETIESEMTKAFQEYAVKLNEEQLGYTVNELVKWASRTSSKNQSKDEVVGFNLHRQTIFNKVMISVVEKLGEYAVPYIQNQLMNIENVMDTLIKEF